MEIKIPTEALPCPHLIAGNWVAGEGKLFEIVSPLNGAVIGQGTEATKSEIDQAVSSAKKAQVNWAARPLKERGQVMYRLREILFRDIEKIAQIVSLENGKTLAESRAGILKGIEVLEYAISLPNIDVGGKMEVSKGVSCEYRRTPLGVVANITPFNFPAMVPMWTLPIAIMLGNSYILKPSEKTPLTSILLGEAFVEAGLPDGVLQIVQGGREAVEQILDHPDIAAVGFVGSSKIAKIVYERASKSGKRVIALGGAKNHIILLPDANPDITGRGISDSFTGCAGQRCMAASVLLAVGEVEGLITKVKEDRKSVV